MSDYPENLTTIYVDVESHKYRLELGGKYILSCTSDAKSGAMFMPLRIWDKLIQNNMHKTTLLMFENTKRGWKRYAYLRDLSEKSSVTIAGVSGRIYEEYEILGFARRRLTSGRRRP